MRLVKFNISKKHAIYINPDKVESIRPYSETKCMIRLEHTAHVVLHSEKEVVSLLTNDTTEGY